MTKEEVKTILKHHFPKAKITKLKEFPEGFNNIAYDVSITNPKKDLVVKLLKCKFHKNVKERAQREQAIYRIIKKNYPKFKLPEIIILDASKKIINKPYLINRKIPGNSLNEVFDQVKNKREIYKQIGVSKAKLHSIKFQQFGSFDSEGKVKKPFKKYHLKKYKEIEELFKELKKQNFPKNFIKNHYALWKEIKPRLKNNPKPSLCHGDPSNTNVIVIKKGKKYKVNALIDFEFAKLGDPMQDLIGSWKEFFKKMYPYLDSLIEGYKRYQKPPKDWRFRVFFHQWTKYLNNLKWAPKTSWRNLTEKQNKERRKILIKKCTEQANKIKKLIEEEMSK